MSGRILIIDTIVTNRIVLKVKMLAAQYAVETCASRAEADAIIALNRPDLILVNLSDPIEDWHDFCRTLKNTPDTTGISIIAVGVADTSRVRFAALDAGADDVMPRPVNDIFLLARIRSLLRLHHAHHESWLRDGTSRALGFEEVKSNFAYSVCVAVLSASPHGATAIKDKIDRELARGLVQLHPDHVLTGDTSDTVPDLFIIDGTAAAADSQPLFRLVADLRARSDTRLTTQLIIVPENQPDVAAMALDLGADDIVSIHADNAEIMLRAKALIHRKRQQDRLRDSVRDGLHAAVTDPLTGLFNRRYADPHLARMLEQSLKSSQPFAVMMMDIDHFKTINDRFGHAAGDHVLKELANRLRDNLRAVDLVARIGGEEFLIAMPQTSVEQASVAADRLRLLVNTRPFPIGEAHPPLRVTVSLGVAVGGDAAFNPPTTAQMCTRADAALYAAKSAGRDKVSISETATV